MEVYTMQTNAAIQHHTNNKHDMSMTPAVEVIDVHHTLPLGGVQVQILNGVSFHVARSEWVALTGPSGSGKSTLLGIIAGLEAPTGGRILLDGMDVTSATEGQLAHIRNQKIGVVFQSFNLIPTLTAQENVEVPLYVSADRRHISRRAQEALERVGLADRRHHRPHQLSGGQQQRVAIARALITQPMLLLADEPTGNLDTRTGLQVLELFARLHDELELTIIVATHDPDIAARASRELHLADGRLASGGLKAQMSARMAESVAARIAHVAHIAMGANGSLQ
jgi:putative ABC transport system ATP-binding protein